MNKKTTFDIAELRAVAMDGVITVGQLREHGVSSGTIANRTKPNGPWQRILPGVILLDRASPTRRQLLRGALEFAGPKALITGLDALRLYGINLPRPMAAHLLVPVGRRPTVPERTILERTVRWPNPRSPMGLAAAPPARATIDATRRLTDPVVIQELIELVLDHGLTTPAELAEELRAGNQRGTAAVRAAMATLSPVRSGIARRTARKLIVESPLPTPTWHVTVCDSRGTPLGLVDAWWPDIAFAWCLVPSSGDDIGPHAPGSLAHLSLTAAGVVVVRTTTDQLRDSPRWVLRRLANGFAAATRRTRPAVHAELPLRAA